MDLKEIQDLIAALDKSSLSEIEIEEEGCRIRLTKGATEVVASQPIHMAAAPQLQQPIHIMPQAGQVGAAPDASASAPPEEVEEVDDGLATIDSPMVGTFYAAPSPTDPPFVLLGDRLTEGQTACIVEAMKLMNEVTAKFPCIIEKALVQNAEPVEFGQPLFSVRPL